MSVCIKIVGCKNLSGTGLYAIIKVDNVQITKSKKIYNTKHPIWNLLTTISDNVGTVVTLHIHNNSTVLGVINLPLPNIPQGNWHKHYFPLKKSGAYVEIDFCKKIGKIISLRRAGKFNLKTIGKKNKEESPLMKSFSNSCKKNFKKSQELKLPAGEITLNLFWVPPDHGFPGFLDIKIKCAKNLDAKDLNGLSDPYCVISLSDSDVILKTDIVKCNVNPVWNYRGRFIINSCDSQMLIISVYDWNRFVEHDYIGDVEVLLDDIEPCKLVKIQTDILRPLLCKEPFSNIRLSMTNPTSLNPIVIIPGLCSSALKVVESHKNGWVGTRVWISIEKIISQKLFNKKSRKDIANEWIQHMKLASDLTSDPAGIKVRPVKGTKGLSYLEGKKIMKGQTYVMGPLISQLKQVGYTPNLNLYAATYDWRLSPHCLEERDGYFSTLLRKIEEMGRPVVLLCHSMGGCVAQYFLNWVIVTHENGQEWIDKHVKCFMAIGVPFLGSPKTVRGLISGDSMGLHSLLSKDHGIEFARSMGSLYNIFPRGKLADATYVRNFDSDSHKKVDYNDILKTVGADTMLQYYEKYYNNSRIYSPEFIMKCPPVKQFVAIYGTGEPTECKYYYVKRKDGSMELDYHYKSTNDNVFVDKGIVYETKDSIQTCREFGVKKRCSGDGTVPYDSLSYCWEWEKSIPDFSVIELQDAKHRDILKHQGFWQHVLNYL